MCYASRKLDLLQEKTDILEISTSKKPRTIGLRSFSSNYYKYSQLVYAVSSESLKLVFGPLCSRLLFEIRSCRESWGYSAKVGIQTRVSAVATRYWNCERRVHRIFDERLIILTDIYSRFTRKWFQSFSQLEVSKPKINNRKKWVETSNVFLRKFFWFFRSCHIGFSESFRFTVTLVFMKINFQSWMELVFSQWNAPILYCFRWYWKCRFFWCRPRSCVQILCS